MTTPEQNADVGRMIAALKVIVLHKPTRQYLLRNDPKAFEQVLSAVAQYLTKEESEQLFESP